MRALKRGVAHAATVALIIGLISVGGVPESSRADEVATGQAAAASMVDQTIVKAADLSQFQPGNIINDATFFVSLALNGPPLAPLNFRPLYCDA